MTSWFEDACNGSGRTLEFPQMSPIEPGSARRKTLSKTRTVKKEWDLLQNAAVPFRFWRLGADTFDTSRSRSSTTAPLPRSLFQVFRSVLRGFPL